MMKEYGDEGKIRRNGWGGGKFGVSQCPELDIASQGETEEEALANLKEALELHLEPLRSIRPSLVRTIEVEVGLA